MVKLSFPHATPKPTITKDAIHIHPTIFSEDSALHLFHVIDLNGGGAVVETQARTGALAPKGKPEKGVLSFAGKTYHLAQSSKLANYSVYIESLPAHPRKNGIAAILTGDEGVCGEAIVVRAASKGWWRRAQALDPKDFWRELTRLNPNLERVPDAKPIAKAVPVSSRKSNSTGDLVNKMRRSKSCH